MEFKLKYGRGKEDPEKAVLPTIVFISSDHTEYDDVRENHKAIYLFLCWWDYYFGFFVWWVKK